LSNAVKYTPNDGKVSIGAEVNDVDNIVRVTVTDSGVGIPEDEIANVFKKFYRVASNNKCAKGTGLGLNLVKKIIEDVHDGKITVKSKVGQGSSFSFDIPLSNNLEKAMAT
jgi:two-component system phosphate regulon sensor histidine kinase PhoR